MDRIFLEGRPRQVRQSLALQGSGLSNQVPLCGLSRCKFPKPISLDACRLTAVRGCFTACGQGEQFVLHTIHKFPIWEGVDPTGLLLTLFRLLFHALVTVLAQHHLGACCARVIVWSFEQGHHAPYHYPREHGPMLERI